MKRRFVHMADVHLGHQQYGSEVRYDDFCRAWFRACDYAVEQGVDFVLIAGDLFHKHQVDPMTLMQAVEGLSRLGDASIPVFAVEGNHDRARLSDGVSWLEYLDQQKLLKLMSADYIGEHSGTSLWTEMWQGIRICGLQYFGSGFPTVLQRLDLDPGEPTIMLMHGGLSEFVPFGAHFSIEDLEPIRGIVGYVALGHIHKFYQADGWVWNPGSPEACSSEEAENDRYILDVTVDTEIGTFDVTPVTIPSRAFWRWKFDVTEFDAVHDFYSTLLDRMGDWLNDEHDERGETGIEPPVLELTLHGTLQFPRSELDINNRLQETVQHYASPLMTRIINKTASIEVAIAHDGDRSRHEIEFQVFTDLIDRDHRLPNKLGDGTKLVQSVKEMSLNGYEAVEIARKIEEGISC